MLSCNRFQLLLKFLHIVDNLTIPALGEAGYDPTNKFKPLIELANRVFQHNYILNKEISIDESLVGCLNWTSIIQFMPNKHHHRFGIKLWMLCDTMSGYAHCFQVYHGKQYDQYEHGHSYDVCMHLMRQSNVLNKGHSLIIDNFFTDMKLGADLLAQQMYLTGTLRKNRRGILKKVLAAKLQPKQQFAMRSRDQLVVCWRKKASQKKPLYLYLTNQVCNMEDVTTSRHQQKRKPAVVWYYHKSMGGTHLSDALLLSR